MAKTQHDQLAKVPLNPPRIDKMPDGSVKINQEDWDNLWKTISNLDYRTGISAMSNPTGSGYGWGFDPNGQVVWYVGDFDNDVFLQFVEAAQQFSIGDNVTVLAGGDIVSFAFGIQSGKARDGDSVTFDPSFPSDVVPTILFGPGGLTYNSTIGSGSDQTVDITPQGLTNNGFTLRAKIYAPSGSITTNTLNFSGSPTTTSDSVTKTGSAEAYDDNYTFDYDITVPAAKQDGDGPVIPSGTTVGLYAKTSGGSYELYKTITKYNNNTGSSATFSRVDTITVDGLGANSEFKIQIDGGTAGSTITGDTLTYDTATITEFTATPSGATSIPWLAIGTRQ